MSTAEDDGPEVPKIPRENLGAAAGRHRHHHQVGQVRPAVEEALPQPGGKVELRIARRYEAVDAGQEALREG